MEYGASQRRGERAVRCGQRTLTVRLLASSEREPLQEELFEKRLPLSEARDDGSGSAASGLSRGMPPPDSGTA